MGRSSLLSAPTRALLLVILVSATSASLAPFRGDARVWGRLLSTSKVLSGDKPLANWAAEGYAFPHEPVRRDLLITHLALQAMDPRSPDHVKALTTWCWWLLHLVHGHHGAEEDIIFPAIENRTEPLPPQMSHDHVWLLAALKRTEDLVRQLPDASPALAEELAGQLRALFTELTTEMAKHLNEEEDVLVPLIRRAWTEQSWDAFLGTLIERLPPVALLVELSAFSYWMPAWCTQAAGCDSAKLGAQIADKVPLPIAALVRYIVQPRYLMALSALEAMINKQPLSPVSRLPTRAEAVLGAALCLLMLAAWFVVRAIVRVVCCRGKTATKVKKQ